MNIRHDLKRPLRRTMLLLVAGSVLIALAYFAWSPGKIVRDGRHDLRSNGIWLQHGWLGDDQWFARNKKDKTRFRDPDKIRRLADLLAGHGVKYVFPHLCPCSPTGTIPQVDAQQTARFLDHFADFKVLPWIGGVLHAQCSPESAQWRTNFVSSAVDLLQAHPRLAGVHINIEPMPSHNADFLVLLKELRQAMPDGKILSLAAYPPPTRWHPFPDVHWDEDYFKQASRHADQLAVMMYDTAQLLQKTYQHLMSDWTADVLNWGTDSKLLLGIPAYDDAGVGYHDPNVENLRNSLLGIHAGLCRFATLPSNYEGIAVYCEWEMDDQEWLYLKKEFERVP